MFKIIFNVAQHNAFNINSCVLLTGNLKAYTSCTHETYWGDIVETVFKLFSVYNVHSNINVHGESMIHLYLTNELNSTTTVLENDCLDIKWPTKVTL